jgi:hypothetical protein
MRPAVLRKCCLRSGHLCGGFSRLLTVIGLVASKRVNDYETRRTMFERTADADGHFKFLRLWPPQNPPLDAIVMV